MYTKGTKPHIHSSLRNEYIANKIYMGLKRIPPCGARDETTLSLYGTSPMLPDTKTTDRLARVFTLAYFNLEQKPFWYYGRPSSFNSVEGTIALMTEGGPQRLS